MFCNTREVRYMREQMEIDKTCVSEMTNEEYREELAKIFEGVESNRLLRYFYIFISEN